MDASVAAIKDASWQDITEDFLGAVKQLDLGELLKTQYFSLLEAMSAIELMDPKMDSGMRLKKCSRKILTFDESLKSGIIKVNSFEAQELIGIIDDTYSHLATWIDGHPLAQTVMTNLYLHDPEKIEDRILKVFSQSILKIVEFIDRLVQTIYCIEEEDFVLNRNQFNLAIHLSDQKVLNSLEDLCLHYEKQSNSNAKAENGHNNDQKSTNANLPVYDKPKTDAILKRLRFTYHLCVCLYSINKNLFKTYWDLNSQADNQLQRTVKLIQQNTQSCYQHLDRAARYLDDWLATVDFGVRRELRKEDESLGDASYPVIMGFEPLINHKLSPASYPRSPVIKSRAEAIECIKNLILRLKGSIEASNTFAHKSFNKSFEAIEEFSKYFRPNSCVISRSLLQTLYLPNRSDKLQKDELIQSLMEYCEPVIQAIRKDEVKSVILDEFLKEALRIFSQVINIYGHNAARQHKRYPEFILSFKNAQYSAYLLKSAFQSNIVYSWITFHLSRLCLKYILAGIELELFSTHEFPYVYWYLYEILYRNERDQIEQAKQLILENQVALINDNQAKNNKSKVKKQRKKAADCTVWHDNCLLCNDAYRYLTGGLFLLTYGLRMQGKIPTPSTEFTTEEIGFEHRFSNITATSVYQSYKKTLDRLEKLEYIYREAMECFTEAKNLFEVIGQHEACLKVCKTNIVVARILASNQDSFVDRNAEFCFEIHPSFPTVKF